MSDGVCKQIESSVYIYSNFDSFEAGQKERMGGFGQVNR